MGTLQTITTEGAGELVVIPRAEYEAMVAELEDAQDVRAARDFEALEARGDVEFLPWDMAKRLRRGENPVALWREHRGMSQKALAAQAQMTGAQLSEIENGKKTGSVATLQKLARALGVTIDELVGVSA